MRFFHTYQQKALTWLLRECRAKHFRQQEINQDPFMMIDSSYSEKEFELQKLPKQNYCYLKTFQR